MKALFVTLLLFAGFAGFAQKQDRNSLENAISSLDVALIAKDSVALKKLLNDNLTYGHTNGLVDTKSDVIGHLFDGKLTFKTIKTQSQTIVVEGNTASARRVVDADVILNGKPITATVRVLQVWVWKKKHWELFARQSMKM
jgi:hypothetical protein